MDESVTAAPPGSSAADNNRAVKKNANRSADNPSSVKETIESILVAFILAFIFRAFIVEAFVIPTGSMAPTLLGAHMRFVCNDCGYRFDVNYSAQQTKEGDLIINSYAENKDYTVFCPNCGYRVPANDPSDPENDASRPAVHYGDRILVLKYLYLFQEPRRWDVVVFKSPNLDGPGDVPTYEQNYIKRLIAKPNESVMILDGDIYIGNRNLSPTDFKIQAKPRYVQNAMWRIVYDNDYTPRGLERRDGATWKQPWTVRAGAGWSGPRTASAQPKFARTFSFDNPAGESTIYFDRLANTIVDVNSRSEPVATAFTDWLGYDDETPNPFNPVHDLKLDFFYQRKAGDGPVRATLTSRDHTFTAELLPGQAKLLHSVGGKQTQIGQTYRFSEGHRPIHVELTNVDYQATLRIDDAQVAQTTAEEYHPDTARLYDEYVQNRPPPFPSAEISAANQTAAISHLSLWRDVYYTNKTNPRQTAPNWGIPSKIQDLGDDEYFVLGDNSLISGDARYWPIPINLPADDLHVGAGRVPGRFMLGKAFFVYWPAGFRPVPGGPALSPNFGSMRFIR
jgi:signal peptidase I